MAATPRTANRADLDTSTPDAGLFGPGSVSWRIHHDPSQLVGGIRALMLQSLHPEVMLGFHGTTGAREDPWGRLMRTANYVNVVVFGTRAEAETASARVRQVHRGLGLDRPEWLLWVHNAAVDSWLSAYRVSGGPLTPDEADAYVAEQVRAAVLVGCEEAAVPRDVEGLAAYLEQIRAELEVTPAAREAVRGVLWPPMSTRVQWTTPARPAWTVAAGIAFGLLPRWARRMFALPGLPTTDLAAAVSARLLRTGLVALPESRRTSPHVAAARTRLGLSAA
jgi:uncharacterized protein (DUF2236 family)